MLSFHPGQRCSGFALPHCVMQLRQHVIDVTRLSCGAPYKITAPGYGTVLVLAGKWVTYPDGHIAGKDSSVDPKDVGQFCSILAGN